MIRTLEVVSREDIGRDQWDAFVNESDESWLWHTFDFQETICTWPRSNDLSFAVLDRGSSEKIVAVVPMRLVKGNAAFFISWNTLDSLGGPAFKNDLGEKLKHKILNYIHDYLITLASECRVVEVNISLSPMAPAFRGERCPRVNPLLELGFSNALTQTWVIDLRKKKDDLWSNMEGRARTAIRKAEKQGLLIRPANHDGDLDIYYQLHCDTYNRTGVQPHPRAYFEAIWRNFLDKGLSRIFFAEQDNMVLAAENFGIYKNGAIYWTGASSAKGLSLEANSLLQWTAIQWMIDGGVEYYETGEAFPHFKEGKLKGLSDFKKSFGGKLYPFYRGRINTHKKKHTFIRLLRELKR